MKGSWIRIAVLTGFLLSCLVSPAAAQWGHTMMGWGMGGFGMIFMMVFWILAIVGLVFLIRWLFSNASDRQGLVGGSSKPGSPQDILKERYARGEIDKEEYEERKRTLQE